MADSSQFTPQQQQWMQSYGSLTPDQQKWFLSANTSGVLGSMFRPYQDFIKSQQPQAGAQPAATTQPQAAGGTFQIDPNANPTDPAVVGNYVKWLSQQPGADQTLASDPNYWIGQITKNGGGVTPDNVGYWNNRSKAGAG